ncbi:MAG: hypothetical protein QOJ99_4075 [Bryobacterales bacterium]|jgi:signal transduction histidine kinase|nr:hypothetical protein [Bryobacterales bacterium]
MLVTFWNSTAKSATQFLLGLVGLALITFAAIGLHLQPGSISLLYLIVVVFVSVNAGFFLGCGFGDRGLLPAFLFSSVVLSLRDEESAAPVATVAFLFTAWVNIAMVARVRRLTEAQLSLRFEERLAERTRIARERHDTLLQSFQGLMLRFQAVYDLLPSGQAKEVLKEVLNHADQAIVEGRDAIQNLRSTAAVTNELAHAMAALGED